MKTKLIALALISGIAGTAVPVLARDAAAPAAKEVIQLKGGSTLYVFKDGKMAKEDKFGRAVTLKRGEVLEAADGRKLSAVGNESAQLVVLQKDGHGN